MSFSLKRWLIVALVLTAGALVLAQSVDFLPHISTHLKVSSFMRTYLSAKDDRDEGASDQFEIGPSLQFYFKPLLILKSITTFDLDDAKPRALVLEMGYRYVTVPQTAPTNRMQTAADPSLSAQGWIPAFGQEPGGSRLEGWRIYLALSEQTDGRANPFDPFLSLRSIRRRRALLRGQVPKWSTTDSYVGCLFPVGKHVQFDTYYEHENNTGKMPNQQKYDIGFVLNLYYSLEKK